MDLKGKVALVTGSTSGIGRGIAQALAESGADVMLNGFGDTAVIEEFRTTLMTTYGVRIAYSGADMGKPLEIAALVNETTTTLGGPDIVVSNAGIQHVANLEDFPTDRWDAIIAVNLSAVFHAMKAAIPGMKQKGWGRIINIASAHGLVASAQKVAYVAAKHGVVGATKVAAIELANSGVTANAICPGWVKTPLVERQLEARAASDQISVAQAAAAFLSEKQPMIRFSTPQSIGALTVFLCSEAAATITGASLSIDGGWTAQ